MMQNVIALIWDFDKTLVNGYMQDPIFAEYGVDPATFWKEVNAMPKKYLEKGIRVNPDIAYLLKFIRDAKAGLFKGLNNEKLRTYGAKQNFYPGIPEFFERTLSLLEVNEECKEFNIRVEHYIVSTGFAEVIKGSALAPLVEGIWGCELIDSEDSADPIINEVAYTIDNTTKTRALFEINKGVNKKNGVGVNAKMSEGQRRVSFKNMIYIADGPSDVPAFSLVKKNEGLTFAVYPKGDIKALNQVEQLRSEGRVDFFAEADYTEGTTTYNWLVEKIKYLANRLIQEERNKLVIVSNGPKHLVED
jgi:hypothetical protein